MSTCFWVTGIWFVSIVEHFLAFFGDFWAKNGHFQAKIGLKWRFYCPKTLCFWAIDSNLSTGWSIRYFLLIFASRDIWSDMFSFLIYHKTHLRWLLANFHIFDSKIEQKQGNLAFRNFWRPNFLAFALFCCQICGNWPTIILDEFCGILKMKTYHFRCLLKQKSTKNIVYFNLWTGSSLLPKNIGFLGNRTSILALFLPENDRFLLKNPQKMQGNAPRCLQIISRSPRNMLTQVGVHKTLSTVIKQLKSL